MTGDDTERVEATRRIGTAVCLLITSRAGTSVVPLEEGASVTLGRGAHADITVADSSLSRVHARIARANGVITISDLGSTNGVVLNGVRVDQAVIAPSDDIVLGAASLSLHDADGRGRLERGFVGIETLRVLLDHEIVRARHAGRPLVLAFVRGKDLGRSASALAESLRPIDRLAFYGPTAAVILMPELQPDLARGSLEAICAKHDLVAGLAALPGPALTSEAMIEAARLAARSAAPIGLAPSAPRAELEGDGPLIASTALRALFAQAERIASSKIPVLIIGESGTGKEVLAQSLHRLGPRSARPMICLNCASIPPQLIEATLFGHARGSFTGAIRDAEGIFAAADGGTVLLDEIADLPLPAQGALLRVLETSRVVRVGSTAEEKVDVRVIAATHRDLDAAADRGEFRKDLLFRLDGARLQIPPLRERGEEIRPLAEHFVARAVQDGCRPGLLLAQDALDVLHRYSWPGNIRELRNAIARAAVVARDGHITAEDLPERVLRGARAAPVSEPPPPDGAPIDLKEELRMTEARLILAALRAEGWNQSRAAERLRLPLRTLVYKIRALGIRRTGYDIS